MNHHLQILEHCQEQRILAQDFYVAELFLLDKGSYKWLYIKVSVLASLEFCFQMYFKVSVKKLVESELIYNWLQWCKEAALSSLSLFLVWAED